MISNNRLLYLQINVLHSHYQRSFLLYHMETNTEIQKERKNVDTHIQTL